MIIGVKSMNKEFYYRWFHLCFNGSCFIVFTNWPVVFCPLCWVIGWIAASLRDKQTLVIAIKPRISCNHLQLSIAQSPQRLLSFPFCGNSQSIGQKSHPDFQKGSYLHPGQVCDLRGPGIVHPKIRWRNLERSKWSLLFMLQVNKQTA